MKIYVVGGVGHTTAFRHLDAARTYAHTTWGVTVQPVRRGRLWRGDGVTISRFDLTTKGGRLCLT